MNVTKKIKALSAMSFAAAAFFLAGCQAQSNSLTFTPLAPSASMNVNQSAVVYVMTRDARAQQERLNASPNVSQLFQQVMQQNLVSKGFRIGQANNSNAGVTVEIKDFTTNVEQGNLRYKLNSKIQLNVYVQGAKGQFNKDFHTTRSQSGAFNADNDEIQKVMGEAFKDIVNNIYQDQEIGQAINQYTN